MGAIDRSRSKKQELELELDAIASIDVFSVWIAVRAGRLIRQADRQDCQGVSLLSQPVLPNRLNYARDVRQQQLSIYRSCHHNDIVRFMQTHRGLIKFHNFQLSHVRNVTKYHIRNVEVINKQVYASIEKPLKNRV